MFRALDLDLPRQNAADDMKCSLPLQYLKQRAATPPSAVYAPAPLSPISLSTLISFGRPLTKSSVLASAQYALSELPRRLARRMEQLEGLPYIVGTNPHVKRTLQQYIESHAWLAAHPIVNSLEKNQKFTNGLSSLVRRYGVYNGIYLLSL